VVALDTPEAVLEGWLMARGDKGFEKAKNRAARGTAAQQALIKKGEEAGQRGKPKLTRKDIKIAKGMDREENG
jgi:hypothetical protein